MEEKISKSISILSTFQSVVTMTIPGLYIQFVFCFYFLMILFFLLIQKSYVNTIHFPVFPVLYSRSDWTRWNANINGIFCVWKQEKAGVLTWLLIQMTTRRNLFCWWTNWPLIFCVQCADSCTGTPSLTSNVDTRFVRIVPAAVLSVP